MFLRKVVVSVIAAPGEDVQQCEPSIHSISERCGSPRCPLGTDREICRAKDSSWLFAQSRAIASASSPHAGG